MAEIVHIYKTKQNGRRLPAPNKFTHIGKHWYAHYNGGCEYPSEFHWRDVQWHHPISYREDIGIWLCQAHHSLLQGRTKKYSAECQIDKKLSEIRDEVYALVVARVIEKGETEDHIDKH